jgi:NAD(P) transhydrogenase
MQTYDLIVIGSGPGGQRAAIQGAKAGKRVAIIEKQASVGGVSINLGTIPSKTMREAVLHLSDFYEQAFYGSNSHAKENITMGDLNFRVQHVIENEVTLVQDQLKRNGVDLIHGPGAFTDPHHIRVELNTGFSEFEAQYVVIAAGTKPAANPKVPVNGRTIINSDQILTMPQIPKTMIVVGGGVIGVEYACIFATLGVRVIVVEMRPRLLEFADNEMVEALTYHMRDHRATLRLNEEVESVEELPDGKVAHHCRCLALRRRTPRQRGCPESARRRSSGRRSRPHQG